MLESSLIMHASPTLARLKLGSLFTESFDSADRLMEEVRSLNALLAPRGLVVTVLRMRAGRALVYLYRESELQSALNDPATGAFLARTGYGDLGVQAALDTLRKRLGESDEFPHEIGVFLGYPLEDVIGFICNEGRNCLCCGCWKVYANECQAMKMFERFRKCTRIYTKLFSEGAPLVRLAVPAASVG